VTTFRVYMSVWPSPCYTTWHFDLRRFFAYWLMRN